jgi:3-oxoadipate enol-lactonase
MPLIPVNGTEIYYEWHGPVSAPVLVLNNGMLMNAGASWRPQTPAFSAHLRVLQYDCRGQGQSAHPDGPYSMDLHADDLAALLDALAVDAAHVLGISYGGEVAQAFALKYARRVLSLILADTVSEVGPELRMVVDGWCAAARSGDADLFFLVTAPWNFSAGFIAQQPALLAAARARYADLDLPAVARLGEAFAGVDFTGRLRQITAPTCIIVGEADILKGPRYASIIQREIAGSELHIMAGAGHAVCWEDAATFNGIVLEFLKTRAPRV